jgi:hypothetical protein
MRFRHVVLLTSGVIVGSSACSMDTTAPASLAALPAATMSSAREPGSGRGHGLLAVGAVTYASTAVYTVRLDPKRPNTLHFGPHSLDVPANALCDEQSGYGLLSFDESCRTEKRPVTITAVVRSTAAGVPRIDFYPAVRFDPTRVVMLRLAIPQLSPGTPIPRVLYCATASTEDCVDEAAHDPTLATQVDYASNTLLRRIKHFSGYYVEW